MHPLVSEGLNLILRWAHLIAGIMWIGSSIFFHWLDTHLDKPAPGKKSEGELWMVHSGGFYEVDKKLIAPHEMPSTLHWFKWEAAFTWITGFFLLVIVYHLGGGVMLVDAAHPAVSPPVATAICMGTLVVAWFAYDLLWSSKLAGEASSNPPLTVALSVIALALIALVLSHYLSGRAAYIHTAAVMGTCMVANVWVRIIPAQKNLVDSVKAGVPPIAALAYNAKRRSKHNHYMTYPVLFIMISNHFPSTFGTTAGFDVAGVHIGGHWVALVLLCGAGALVKLWMNKVDPPASVMLAFLGVLLAVTIGASILPKVTGANAPLMPVVPDTPPGRPITEVGRIVGKVTWEGAVPAPREVALYGGCERGHDGPLKLTSVSVGSGELADVFVHVSGGVEGYKIPKYPDTELKIDQKGCLYSPRVAGLRVGQPVYFVNSDPVFHNVRSVASANETWSINQPAQGQHDAKTFMKPEVMVATRCDVHPWMVAHIGVVDHPWFTVTDERGRGYAINGVPAGEIEVSAWHEVGGVQKQKVTVPAGGEVRADFVFTARPAPP